MWFDAYRAKLSESLVQGQPRPRDEADRLSKQIEDLVLANLFLDDLVPDEVCIDVTKTRLLRWERDFTLGERTTVVDRLTVIYAYRHTVRMVDESTLGPLSTIRAQIDQAGGDGDVDVEAEIDLT